METKLIDRTTLDEAAMLAYVHVDHVLAQRVEGPFCLQTVVGRIICEDGYVVMAEDRRLFAMERKLFERSYVPYRYGLQIEQIVADGATAAVIKAVTITPDD